MVRLISFIIIFFVIFSVKAYAISMGTVVKNDFNKISSSDSAKFRVLFWNADDNNYRVELKVKESPEGWTVIIEPNNFDLNSSIGKEYIKLPYRTNSVKATPVDIIVKPSSSVKPGRYEIHLTANSELSVNELSLSQERVFNFVVEIENPLFFKEEEKQNSNQIKEDQIITGKTIVQKKENTNFNYFYLIIIVLIILASLLIYRYS